MAENSKIEWTHHTANLWWGCAEVHAGCDNCYAATLSNRWGNDLWGNDKPRKMIKSTFRDLKKYQEQAALLGEIHRVFVGSMMDIFEKPMPLIINNPGYTHTSNLRTMLFQNIEFGLYPNLMFLFLTKRPSNINKYITGDWMENPPENVIFGTSPVDQETANKLIPQLLQVKGKRFLSIEPQLGPIDLTKIAGIEKIDWIIVGGESGTKRRPYDLYWGRSLREQCKELGIPFFFKQVDKVIPIPQDLLIREFY